MHRVAGLRVREAADKSDRLRSVEQTLRSGYACTQDGQFEQEFVFRVE